MPFTPSHAVVALPFVRTPLLPAAIAVGAMTPDLPLFVRSPLLGYGRTHDLAWLPVTTLVALALLLVWRCALRPATRELSPRWLAARLPVEWDRGAAGAARDALGVRAVREQGRPQRWSVSWRGILLLVASLVIGVVSHIVWDLFTHKGRWGAVAIPALAEQWGPLEGYKWLQHTSSVVGLAIIVVWAGLWLGRREAAAVPTRPEAPGAAPAARGVVVGTVPRLLPGWLRWAWWLSLPVLLAAGWLVGLAVWGPLDADFTPAHLAYRVLPPVCGLWGVATVVLALGIQFARGRTRAPR